jgi:hypothetical protein
MLVGGLAFSFGHGHDGQVPEPGVGPRDQVGEPGLLGPFAPGDGQRVALPRVAVPADLQPGLLALVPAEQHAGGFGVGDQRGGGDVQGDVATPRTFGRLDEGSEPVQVGLLGGAFGLVVREEGGQRVGFHERRC